jgi:hypothetical protein
LKLSKRIDGNNESLKPNVIVILETSVPDKTPYKQGYNFYSKNILPIIGKFSKDDVTTAICLNQPSLWRSFNILKSWVYRCDALPQTFR